MNTQTRLIRVADLSESDQAALSALSLAVYPPEEWRDWPGRNLEWATPEWFVCVWNGEGELVSSTGVVLREGEHDGRSVGIGGVGGVKTHPAQRGRGYAALAVQRATEFFQKQENIDFALLVCEPQLIRYYSGLGWREFSGRLLVRQRGAIAEFTFNRVMTLGIHAPAPAVGTIDLCGPPW